MAEKTSSVSSLVYESLSPDHVSSSLKLELERYETRKKNTGFHGDAFLISAFMTAMQNATQFVESGTHLADTLEFMASCFPTKRCFSCEIDQAKFQAAHKRLSDKNNVVLVPEASPNFLKLLNTCFPSFVHSKTCFWLDAHLEGVPLPIREELAIITSHFSDYQIFIDDFLVPGQAQFGFDSYSDGTLELSTIEPHLAPGTYGGLFPNYDQKTSLHHPLRGWVYLTDNKSLVTEISRVLGGRVDQFEIVRR